MTEIKKRLLSTIATLGAVLGFGYLCGLYVASFKVNAVLWLSLFGTVGFLVGLSQHWIVAWGVVPGCTAVVLIPWRAALRAAAAKHPTAHNLLGIEILLNAGTVWVPLALGTMLGLSLASAQRKDEKRRKSQGVPGRP